MPRAGTPAFLPPAQFVHAPGALTRAWSQDDARAYTRWLATHHYENFHVASFLLPKRLHQDFYNVYAYCRWADDLGDEIGDREESLRLLSPGIIVPPLITLPKTPSFGIMHLPTF